MLAIKKNIETFYDETEQSATDIIEGSDEHLDFIISISKSLNILSKKFEDFNDLLYSFVNTCSNEDIKKVMSQLKRLNRACFTLIGAIRLSLIRGHIRTSYRIYTKQHDILREIIYDIQHFRLAKDKEFDNIMNELNDL